MQAMHHIAQHSQSPGRRVVVGLGRTGLSCARYLRERGIAFAVTDSRATPPELQTLRQMAPDVEVRTGGFEPALLDGAVEVIASPGVSLRESILVAARERGIPVIGDIELFAREARAPIAAITGTNGKSTVTTLVARMSQAAGKRTLAGGNLGRPALELLAEPSPDLYVLELSSFQLETTHTLQTAAATVLNVTPDHMDRYATVAEYAASKARIFDRCDVAIINADDDLVRDMPRPGQRVLSFSVREGSSADYRVAVDTNDVRLLCGEEPLLAMSELKIAGLHNAANALAAIAMCDALDLPRISTLDALRSFPGLPHRSQWVAEIRGVRYVDDSKGTNVGATLAAVAGMPGPLVVIAGGQGKGQDFAPLRDAFRGKVRHVVLLGEDGPLIENVLHPICSTSRALDMDQAVHTASCVAQPGDTVLLSPACASLDMFRDYAHRGDVFAAAVRRLSA